ncbi:MAG: class I SAM-dependent methyltransferase [Arenibacter sp.]
MKRKLDRFYEQSKIYSQYRPTYPARLYQYIYSFCEAKNACWDCGTGNGQVAVVLSKSFAQVFASDISKQQIQQAVRLDNIEYTVQRAEQTSFVNDSFDLITVAQAVHWFDLHAFNHEVKRVLKPNGIIAIWGYGLLRINAEIDPIILHFYNNIIGAYWDKERDYIDLKYSSIPFNFDEIDIKDTFKIETSWTLLELEGYFNSWSSVQNFMKKNNGHNPVDQLIKEISLKWNSLRQKITFPIFMRLGRNAK